MRKRLFNIVLQWYSENGGLCTLCFYNIRCTKIFSSTRKIQEDMSTCTKYNIGSHETSRIQQANWRIDSRSTLWYSIFSLCLSFDWHYLSLYFILFFLQIKKIHKVGKYFRITWDKNDRAHAWMGNNYLTRFIIKLSIGYREWVTVALII